MSLVTRIVGTGLTLLAGFMIGYVQGLQSIVDAVSNLALQVAQTIPNTPLVESGIIANVFGRYATADVNPDFGVFWEFGIILAIIGFILVAAGDRKPRSSQAEPLLLQPLPENQQK